MQSDIKLDDNVLTLEGDEVDCLGKKFVAAGGRLSFLVPDPAAQTTETRLRLDRVGVRLMGTTVTVSGQLSVDRRGIKTDGDVTAKNLVAKAVTADTVTVDAFTAETVAARAVEVSGSPRSRLVTKTFTVEITPKTILKTEHIAINMRDAEGQHRSETTKRLDVLDLLVTLQERLDALEARLDRAALEVATLRADTVQATDELVVGRTEPEGDGQPLPLQTRQYIRVKHATIEQVTTTDGLQFPNPRVLDVVEEIKRLREDLDSLRRQPG